jgi:hypothetical protein
LDKFKVEILKCADEESALKGGLCNTTIAQQLRYFILENGAKPDSKPFYIGAVLRVNFSVLEKMKKTLLSRKFAKLLEILKLFCWQGIRLFRYNYFRDLPPTAVFSTTPYLTSFKDSIRQIHKCEFSVQI